MAKGKFGAIQRIVTSGKSGRKGAPGFMGNASKEALELAGNVDKETFMGQLFEAWYAHIKPNEDLDTSVKKAWARVDQSGFRPVFEKVDVTEEDLKKMVIEIRQMKSEVEVERAKVKELGPDQKVGRNDKCPCGSGKKFKKCCGK